MSSFPLVNKKNIKQNIGYKVRNTYYKSERASVLLHNVSKLAQCNKETISKDKKEKKTMFFNSRKWFCYLSANLPFIL